MQGGARSEIIQIAVRCWFLARFVANPFQRSYQITAKSLVPLGFSDFHIHIGIRWIIVGQDAASRHDSALHFKQSLPYRLTSMLKNRGLISGSGLPKNTIWADEIGRECIPKQGDRTGDVHGTAAHTT